METIVNSLPYIQIALSVILVALVLLQQSDADLGGAFGGSADGSNSPAHTRRGAERTLFSSTIVVAILFVVSVFIGLIKG